MNLYRKALEEKEDNTEWCPQELKALARFRFDKLSWETISVRLDRTIDACQKRWETIRREEIVKDVKADWQEEMDTERNRKKSRLLEPYHRRYNY